MDILESASPEVAEKIENNTIVDIVDAPELSVEEAIEKAPRVVFVSGHTDLDIKDYIKWYAPIIQEYVEQGCYFVLGDSKGVDTYVQYQLNHLLKPEDHNRVKIFFKGFKPAYILSENFYQLGGFDSHEEAAVAMTICSDIDVAFINPGREDTITARNILRRTTMNYNFKAWSQKKKRHVDFWKVITGGMTEELDPEIILN